MLIKSLTGSFGCLQGEVFTPGPGLNLIEAPNESGKSTWAALLRVVLYGLNTRDRAADADKRKYQPWNGAPMEGSLTADTALGEITITRRTLRPGSPMGAFSAVYAGTAQEVEGLTADTCGEVLLGVPPDVYRRSAFIHQSGLVVDQSAALEQRISAIVTEGDGEISYADAAAQLKKQMNRRRSSRSTGLLPQLEAEEARLRDLLSQTDALTEQIDNAQAQLDSCLHRQADIQQKLALHDAADSAALHAEAQSAQEQLARAEQQRRNLQQRLSDLPSRQELMDILREIDGVDAAAIALEEADHQAENAAMRMAKLEDQVQEEKPSQKAKSLSPLWGVLAAVLGLIFAAAVGFSSGKWAAAISSGFGLIGLLLIMLYAPRKARTAAPAADNLSLYNEASAAWQSARSLQERCAKTYSERLEHVLARVRPFCETADHGSIRAAVNGAIGLLDQLTDAIRQEDTAKMRVRLCPAASGDFPSAARPAESRDVLEDQLAQTVQQAEALRRSIHLAQGQRKALGDSGDLADRLVAISAEKSRRQRELDALSLASQALERADQALQRRFSPALGEMSATIFTKLTREKYNKVLLDRMLRPSAQETGQLAPRETMYLSQGTADQLYLAVRLAICQLALPSDDPAPILLDDALVTFDDSRMAAALDYLAELSRHRQILLFTCQKREKAYLEAAHPGVFRCVQI